MAVPAAAYRKIEVDLNNAAGVGIAHKAGILQTSVAVMKARFYLDELIEANDAAGNGGIIGIVFLGSTNYQMRSAARFGNGGYSASGNWLNDLFYTKGFTAGVPDFTQYDVVNLIVRPFNVVSAYYFDGAYGVQYKKNNGPWIDVPMSDIPQNTSLNSVARNLATYVEYQDDVYVRSYHTNIEGTYYSPVEKRAVIALGAIELFYSSNYASEAYSYDTYYISKMFIMGGRIYSSASGTSFAPAGYYVDKSKTPMIWYRQNNAYQVVEIGTGQPGHWPDGDPANGVTPLPYEQLDFAHYQAALFNLCTTPVKSPITLYRRRSDSKYFYDPAMTLVANNGYYLMEYMATYRRWTQLVLGFENSADFCPE